MVFLGLQGLYEVDVECSSSVVSQGQLVIHESFPVLMSCDQ